MAILVVMSIPNLHPDITFEKLGPSQSECDFAFEAKRAAMGPHILKAWEWDEKFQRDVHNRNYEAKPFYAIRIEDARVGTLSFQPLEDYIRFGEFYLRPSVQGRGTGTKILTHCLTMAESMRLPTRLEYLHWNPVASLYARHGFKEIGRSDTHIFMERPTSRPR
ncbi:MAG: GNAT family N-acetyltransferase [Aliishimia sp.]